MNATINRRGFSDPPNEIWCRIFSFLDIKNRRNVAYVCCRFREIELITAKALCKKDGLNPDGFPEQSPYKYFIAINLRSKDLIELKGKIYETNLQQQDFSKLNTSTDIHAFKSYCTKIENFNETQVKNLSPIFEKVQKTQNLFFAHYLLDYIKSQNLETYALRQIVEKFEIVLNKLLDTEINLEELKMVCEKWKSLLIVFNMKSEVDSFRIRNNLFLKEADKNEHRLKVINISLSGGASKNLIDMPQKFLSIIFSYLDVKSIPSVCRTCRVFNRISNKKSLWIELCRRHALTTEKFPLRSTKMARSTLKLCLIALPKLRQKINVFNIPVQYASELHPYEFGGIVMCIDDIKSEGLGQILREAYKTENLLVFSKLLDHFSFNSNDELSSRYIEPRALRPIVQKFDDILEQWKNLSQDARIDRRELKEICDRWQQVLSDLNTKTEPQFSSDGGHIVSRSNLFTYESMENEERIKFLNDKLG